MPRTSAPKQHAQKQTDGDGRHRAQHNPDQIVAQRAPKPRIGEEPFIIQEANKLFDRLRPIPFGKAEVDSVKERVDDENDIHHQRRDDKGVTSRVIAQLAVGEELADAVGHVTLS